MPILDGATADQYLRKTQALAGECRQGKVSTIAEHGIAIHFSEVDNSQRHKGDYHPAFVQDLFLYGAKLHLTLVGVCDRDYSVVRPPWASHPLPFLDHLPVGVTYNMTCEMAIMDPGKPVELRHTRPGLRHSLRDTGIFGNADSQPDHLLIGLMREVFRLL
jgi:hypothetical protein